MPKNPYWCLLVFMAMLTYFPLLAESVPTGSSDETALSTIQLNEANLAYDSSNYKLAVEKYLDLLDKPQFSLTVEQKAEAWYKTAKSYQRLEDYSQALEYYARFLAIAEQTSLQKDQSRALGYIASIHQKMGNFEESLTFLRRALKLNERNKDSIGIARSLYQLGTFYHYQNKYEESLQYYHAAIALSKKMDSKKSVFSCYAGLGSAHIYLGNLDSALVFNFLSLEYANKYKAKYIGYALNNIGYTYVKLTDYDCADWYLHEAIRKHNESKDTWGLIGTYSSLGELYMGRGDFDKAINEFSRGLVLSREIDSKTREVELYPLLSEAYYKGGEAANAYLAMLRYTNLKDSLKNEEMERNMEFQRMQDNIQNQKSEIALLKKDFEILENKKQLRTSSVVAIVLFFFFLLIGYRYYSQRRYTRKLADMNERIKRQNRQLEFNNSELKKFAYVASHDLKAPLRSIGSFTGLLQRRYGHLFDQSAKEYMNFIVDGATRMYQLLDDLLAYSNIEKLAHGKEGVQTSLEDWLDTRQVVREAINNLSYRIDEQQADISVNEKALPKLKANHSHITQLFQNLIDNSLKFKGQERPKISIDCSTDEQQHTFSVRDNGIGIDPEFREKIFDMFHRLHGVAYEGTGIGLATCRKIIERHGGEIWVESQPGLGSTFYFSLPK